MKSGAIISVEGIEKAFAKKKEKGNGVPVFSDVWFDIQQGEFVCLIGHSGCGKTTLLNILAGLEFVTAGVILANGKEIVGPALDRAVIFQHHALLPWMSVQQNLAFALKSKWPRAGKDELEEKISKILSLVNLTEAKEKRPAELSGGMKQRVGIARALAIDPKVLLMDEPFSALDALTRGSLQDSLIDICQKTNQTAFMITHDIDEAILLADKIILMTNGPNARICEIVRNTLPKGRRRADMHRHANYYPMRNHLLDFLVSRSQKFLKESVQFDPRNPPIVSPA